MSIFLFNLLMRYSVIFMIGTAEQSNSFGVLRTSFMIAHQFSMPSGLFKLLENQHSKSQHRRCCILVENSDQKKTPTPKGWYIKNIQMKSSEIVGYFNGVAQIHLQKGAKLNLIK